MELARLPVWPVVRHAVHQEAGRRRMSSGKETTIVDNEVYNLIKTTATKLEGLAAYDKYQQDGQANDPIWQQLRQQDQQAVRQLLQQLAQFAQQGKLTAK